MAMVSVAKGLKEYAPSFFFRLRTRTQRSGTLTRTRLPFAGGLGFEVGG